MTPACYVVSAAEWSQAVDALGNAFVLVVLVVWAAGVDWWQWEWRYRKWRRRVRLRRIRQARSGPLRCYQCGRATLYLFPDSRCSHCTRLTPEEMR